MIDEIDNLPDSTLERLFSLFDGDRMINHPQLGKVEVHPQCILIGAMN